MPEPRLRRGPAAVGDGPLPRQPQTQAIPKASYDEAVTARLWQVSAELVGLTGGRPMPSSTLAAWVLPTLC